MVFEVDSVRRSNNATVSKTAMANTTKDFFMA
jgi:hypothetical protein